MTLLPFTFYKELSSANEEIVFFLAKAIYFGYELEPFKVEIVAKLEKLEGALPRLIKAILQGEEIDRIAFTENLFFPSRKPPFPLLTIDTLPFLSLLMTEEEFLYFEELKKHTELFSLLQTHLFSQDKIEFGKRFDCTRTSFFVAHRSKALFAARSESCSIERVIPTIRSLYEFERAECVDRHFVVEDIRSFIRSSEGDLMTQVELNLSDRIEGVIHFERFLEEEVDISLLFYIKAPFLLVENKKMVPFALEKLQTVSQKIFLGEEVELQFGEKLGIEAIALGGQNHHFDATFLLRIAFKKGIAYPFSIRLQKK